jgi:hypothetical protein
MEKAQTDTSFFSGYLFPILVRVGLPLLVWSLLTEYLDQYFVDQVQNELISDDGAGPRLWVFGSLSMLLSLIAPVFSTLLILFAARAPRQQSLVNYFGNHLSWLVKEQIRALGKMLSWSLLFIIPGIVKFFEFVMLPFVVCLSPRYQQGQLDALKGSGRFFYKHWLAIVGLTVGTTLFSLALTSADTYRSFTDHPASATLLCIFDLVVFVGFQWLYLRLWERHTKLEESL